MGDKVMLRQLRFKIDMWCMRNIGGHRNFNVFGNDVTFYGWNAMQFAVNIRLKNGLFLCYRPPNMCHCRFVSWYLYLSPDATPNSAIWLKRGRYGFDKAYTKDER